MTKIFDGINEKNFLQMCNCFNAKTRSYKAEETITNYSGQNDSIGVLLSGEAVIVKYDFDGNRTIHERLSKNDIFGKLFTYLTDDSDTRVVCSKDCEVLFIDYYHIVKRCEKACEHHSVLVSNMLSILSERSIDQSAKIDILSQRTLRKKLLSYFNLEAKKQGKATFILPFSLASLADYLCVDRSAMLREMKKMREDGIIISKAKKITILKPEG
ncbi:MAG: Crp/Fnr family transcriptional regulator [Ruminococcus sp.]|nr:Crp/Fnr family transcriptional regulator [Ruminococcus sp.]